MDKSKIKVLIVDDSQLVQMVLAEILEKDPGIEVVASVSGGKEALDVLDQFCADDQFGRKEAVTDDSFGLGALVA